MSRPGAEGREAVRDDPVRKAGPEEERVLVLTPWGGDAPMVCRLLSGAGLRAEVCPDLDSLCASIRAGAGAAVVAEEALRGRASRQLSAALSREPTWSDFPLLVLITSRYAESPWDAVRHLEGTSHLTLLERPLRTTVLLSAARTAVEARRKQYQVRDELAARREAEEALRESAELTQRQFTELEAIYDSAHVGLCVLDEKGRFVRINERMAEMNGLAVREHLGRTPGEVAPDVAEMARNLHERVMMTGEPVLNLEVTAQTPARPGELRNWVEHWLPLRNEEGEVVRVSVVAEEITERKRAQEELRRMNRELRALTEELEERVRDRTARLAESEARYRGLVENTLDIPFSLAPDGTIRYVGPQAERYGFHPGDLRDHHFLHFVDPDDRRRVAEDFRRMVESGENLPLDFRIRAPDGGRYWMEERGLLVRGAGGEVRGVTGVLRDVTERKKVEALRARQEEQLRHLAARLASAQDEEQRRIAQGLHDDVAQLLTACSVKLAVARKADGARRRRAVHDEIDTLLAEATDKIRSLSFELASSALRELGLVKAVVELCRDMSERFGMDFHLTPPAEIPELPQSTETVLFKAVRELLFNVVRHAETTEASVVVRREDGNLSLSVEDPGVGFPEVSETDYVDLGKGLGLFGIRERMKDLGGGVRIESAPGAGSRVTLHLPMGRGRPDDARGPEAPPGNPEREGRNDAQDDEGPPGR